MPRKIAIVGAGAVGYAGSHMVQAGEDVTFIDPLIDLWPAHVEPMRKHSLRVT